MLASLQAKKLFYPMNPLIDNEIVTIILEEKIDFICSVPCNMLAGVLKRLHTIPITHIPVTREEEGVGIAAGAALGGSKPALLMQNAQMPMGKATPNFLKAARIDYVRIKKREDLIKMRRMIRKSLDNNRVTAILLLRTLWDETH
jgi:sulfopyruvate decarboxylase TPP-binding subunit